jgi:uncharacterized protein YodC (DUF2158 family)
MSFQVGDVVRLKSGGPTMTVEEIDDAAAYVVWMDAKGSVSRDSFPPQLLETIAKDTIAFSD